MSRGSRCGAEPPGTDPGGTRSTPHLGAIARTAGGGSPDAFNWSPQRGRIRQWCPDCRRLVDDAHLELTRERGILTSDRSRCPECGRTLWWWVWDPGAPTWRPERPRGQMSLSFPEPPP